MYLIFFRQLHTYYNFSFIKEIRYSGLETFSITTLKISPLLIVDVDPTYEIVISQ